MTNKRKCWYCGQEFEHIDDKEWFCSDGCADKELENDRLVTDEMQDVDN